ncbi:type VII secretion protein EccB [Actinomycetes bacterium KLBMP 9797]
MPTRRDQLQSYQFMMQRVVSAFAHHDTDPVQPAGRRLFGAGLGGVMVAVLALAGVGVYALIRPGGNTNWRDGQSVIVERETGTRFVYREGVLYPMANYASALLAQESAARTVRVAAKSMLGVPRGPVLGITGAPDAVPPPGRLLGPPWTVCAQPARSSNGRPSVSTGLLVGAPVGAGRDLGDDALLAEDLDTGAFFLVWHQRRHAIADRRTVFTALGLDRQPRTPVSAALLDVLPAGEPLAPRDVPGRGRPSTAVAGARIGQVYFVDGAGAQRQYLLVADAGRFAVVTAVEASLLLAAPATRAAYPGAAPGLLPLSPADAAAAGKVPAPAAAVGALPAAPPRIVAPTAASSATAAVCAEFRDAVNPPRLVVDAPAGPAAVGAAVARRSADGAPLADRVAVAPGWAALVEAMPSPEAPSGTRYLVTDLGVRHPLADPRVQDYLGYGAVTPVRLPAAVVARMPQGPALDPAAARRPL